MQKIKKVCIPAGPTVVWKKGRDGKVKPTVVTRKAYCRTVKLKK
jgi:hypothetical protein